MGSNEGADDIGMTQEEREKKEEKRATAEC